MANLARDIRVSGESNDLRDPFDLAGFNQPRLEQLVRRAARQRRKLCHAQLPFFAHCGLR